MSYTLAYAPPTLVSPVTINVPVSGYDQQLDNTKDYIIQLPTTQTVTGSVKINGGRNVVCIGGSLLLSTSSHGTGRAMYISDSSTVGAATPQSGRIVHIEGINVVGGNILGTAPNGAQGSGDGIDYGAPTANIRIQNCRTTHMQGYYGVINGNSYHADCSQNQGGALSVWYDHFTFDTNYQGLFCNPTPAAITNGMKFSNMDGSFFQPNQGQDGRDITYLLWNQANTTTANGTGYTHIALGSNVVFSNSRSGQTVKSNTVWIPSGVTGVFNTQSGANITFSGMNITGTLIDGNQNPSAIPAGGFCTTSSCGLGYVSPGYGTNPTPPPPTPPTPQGGIFYRAHNNSWYPKFGTVIPSGTPGQIQLPAQPAGLTLANRPSGLHVVAADGFSILGPAFGAVGSLFGVQVAPGFNSNEVETFTASQVAVNANGLNLTAQYVGTWATGPNLGYPQYKSGFVWSTPTSSLGGAPGTAGTGFLWLPDASVNFVIEGVISTPLKDTTTNGNDCAYWSSGPKGRYEIDHQEWIAGSTFDSAELNVLNHVAGTASNPEYQDFNGTYMADGNFHTYTCVVRGVTAVDMYVDQRFIGTSPWATGTNPVEPMGLILSYGLRNLDGINLGHPTFTTSRTMTVRSIEVWCTNPTAGTLTGSGEAETLTGGYFLGGGAPTGTVVLS